MKLSDEIHSMFTELMESLKSSNVDWRKSMKNNFDEKMDDLVKRSDPYRELHKQVKYTRNDLGSWFATSYIPTWNRQTNLLNRLLENTWS
jgi:hypothetical protein